MNLLQKIFGRKKAAVAPYNPLALTSNLLPVLRFGWNTAIYPTVDIERSFQRAFADNAIFYAVADRIAQKFGHVPRYVYKREQQKAKRMRLKSLDENIADGELMALLLQPNDNQGQDSFFYLCALSYLTTGECFIWKNRGGIEGGKPVEMYVIPPWCISPVSDGTMYGVKYYELRVGGQPIPLPAEDVILWKKPNLVLDQTGTQLRGFSPMAPLRKLLTQADSITDASVSMYQQGGAKGILYNKTLDNLSDPQKEAIQAVVDKKINNSDKKGAVATIQGDWGYLNIGLDSVDMELLKASEAVIKDICFALGFPAELYQSDSTFANKEQAWHFFITNTLMPMCASFDGELNRGLKADFSEKGNIGSDFSDLPEMQAMAVKLVAAAKDAWWKTPDEKRQMTMDEPFGTPEMEKVYIPTGFVPIDEASIGAPPNDNTGDYATD